MYVGRVHRDKGVFDILEMAQKVDARAPGQVQWDIYGSGPDLDELRHTHHLMGLGSILSIPGWTSLEGLCEGRAKSHVSIVPTRSSFQEGMAMTAVE